MENNKGLVRKGILTLVEMYQLVVVILKLCEVIDWSWWLVMLPTIVGAGIGVILVIAFMVVALMIARNDAKIARLKREAREKKYK